MLTHNNRNRDLIKNLFFAIRSRPKHTPAALALLLTLSIAGQSCAPSAPKRSARPADFNDRGSLRDEGRRVFADPAAGHPDLDRAPEAADSAWSIALVTFRGSSTAQGARDALGTIQTTGLLPSAYIQRRGPATVIAYGSYPSPDDVNAQADLKRLQALVIQGEQPYAFAFLSPPYQPTDIGGNPRYNLAGAKLRYGDAALYSLQIGAYGRDDISNPTSADLAEARQRAEEAATLLRQEGELAFYYHGPRRSMVTVGIFDTSDFDPSAPRLQSRRLRDTRERFPHNLYNGAGIREMRPGMRRPKMQASQLVNIPSPPASR